MIGFSCTHVFHLIYSSDSSACGQTRTFIYILAIVAPPCGYPHSCTSTGRRVRMAFCGLHSRPSLCFCHGYQCSALSLYTELYANTEPTVNISNLTQFHACDRYRNHGDASCPICHFDRTRPFP